MSEYTNYWLRRKVNRRAVVRGAGVVGVGGAAYAMVGCGDDDSTGSPTSEKGLLPTAQASPTPAKQPKPGGTFSFQIGGNPPSLDPYTNASFLNMYMGGLSYSRLLRYKAGTPEITPTDPSMEPELAQTMPEQPDASGLQWTFKLKPGIKFHNGRAMTSEDVKYAFDRYSTFDKSSHRALYFFLDSVSTPDPQTVVLKTKLPYADLNQVIGGEYGAYISPKEHAESDAAPTKMLGSGPFIHTEFQTGSSLSFKKNPDYFEKPWPYFDEVKVFIITDQAKRVADFSAKQQNLSWLFLPDERDQLKKNRPDALSGEQQGIAEDIYMRSDKAPFKDQRMRQAVSMAQDRKALRDAITKGEGVPDQVNFVGYAGWARQVKELGANAKFWDYAPAESKKLMDAAGYKGEELEFVHVAEANIYTQAYLDTASLAIANLKAVGFNIKEIATPYAQYIAAGTGVYFGGQYNHMGLTPRAVPYLVDHVTDKMSFKDGKRGRINQSYVNDPALEALLDKQRTQFNKVERLATVKQIEDMAALNQWEVFFSTDTRTYFWDKEVANYRDSAFFPYTHVMKAWFDKA
jgi:peptide/nickel transport system substrate-binding protein